MPFYDTQVTIPTVDNDVANYATNTFHFEADDLTALGLVHTQLFTFYNTLQPRLSSLCRQTNWLIKSYLQTDPKPRAPVLETIGSLSSPPSATPLPPEVALCISFQGTRMSGVNQARRRGRVYLPFLRADASGTDGRPTAAMMTTAVSCGQGLLTASDSAATWAWQTLSTVAPGVSTVVDGWVDNEWDVQRRRGRRYLTRTTFT
jgi:hypothetical protein